MHGGQTHRLLRGLTLFALVFIFQTARAVTAPASPISGGRPVGLWDLAWSPDGEILAVTDSANDRVALVAPEAGGSVRWISVPGQPRGLCWSDDDELCIAGFSSGEISVVGTPEGNVRRRIPCGGKPINLALTSDTLVIADYGFHQIVGLSLESGTQRFRVPAERHPAALAISPDGRLAVTGGLLPAGPATVRMASAVAILGLPEGNVLARLSLPGGSSNLRGIALSVDGAHAFVVHTRGQLALPTTQPDRGWINNNAVSVLDLKANEWIATFLLDTPTSGAADPWGVAALDDGRVAISASGTGDLILFDWPRIQRLLAGEETLPIGEAIPERADPGTPAYGGTPAQLWARIAKDPAARSVLSSDLAATTGPGLAPRFPTGARGLRALALSPDGLTLAAIAYFDSAVLLIDSSTGQVRKSIPLAPSEPETPERRGERLFHDANQSFQSWMSCATCHHEGRTDGINWDLMNDGIGNPKNTKSMLFAPQTEPMTWLGVREDYVLSIKKGMHFFMTEPDDSQVQAIAAYFNSLQPEPSPYLVDGGLSESALRGKEHFAMLSCAACHSGPLFTDQRKHRVGTGSEEDGGKPYDTPSLIELWRTAPYLHDGSASDVRDVLITRDPGSEHGDAADLPPDELNDLITYLLSL